MTAIVTPHPTPESDAEAGIRELHLGRGVALERLALYRALAGWLLCRQGQRAVAEARRHLLGEQADGVLRLLGRHWAESE